MRYGSPPLKRDIEADDEFIATPRRRVSGDTGFEYVAHLEPRARARALGALMRGAAREVPHQVRPGWAAPPAAPRGHPDPLDTFGVPAERAAPATQVAINALVTLCLEDVRSGAWDESLRLATEGLRLCEAHAYPELRWPLWLASGLIAAARGDDGESGRCADEIERWGRARVSREVQLHACYLRGLAALGRGDYESAYRHLSALMVPSVWADHRSLAVSACLDVVQSAVRTDRRTDAESYAGTIETVGVKTLSPRARMLTGGASAVLAPAGAGIFERSLAIPEIDRWPFDVARVELAYGEHLRRARSITAARKHLTVAAEVFRDLGAAPWLARATTELQAAGTSARSGVSPAQPLTHQELEIARFAAAGLTNKEIAARVYLSHRTVGTHLYRIFPKLGISSRTALRDALSAISAG